jgi:hypothetical protein
VCHACRVVGRVVSCATHSPSSRGLASRFRRW